MSSSSLNGLQNLIPNTLDGLFNVNASSINVNGLPVNPLTNTQITFNPAVLPTLNYSTSTGIIDLNLPFVSTTNSGIVSITNYILADKNDYKVVLFNPLTSQVTTLTPADFYLHYPPVIQPFFQILDFTGAEATIQIQPSANNVCRVRLLGGGGGGGAYNNGGNSGAGGFTIYHFSTSGYFNNQLRIKVGEGGEGATLFGPPGRGGFPNGGAGMSGDVYSGGGGGRCDVRIGNPNLTFNQSVIIAIAGAGGGGTGYIGGGGAGGGLNGQAGQGGSTGGSQVAGGFSPTGFGKPPGFIEAGFLQGASGPASLLQNQNQDTGGGGDGYYGGGAGGGDGNSSAGGSGFINQGLSGYISTFQSISSNTFAGSGISIPSQASNDPNFVTFGGGILGASRFTNPPVKCFDGGAGRVIVEFL